MSLSYTHHQRTGLSLTQPNSSPWAQSYTYDRMHRLTNLTSTAGSFASEYYAGASTLLRKLTQPSGAFVTNTYDSVARLLSTTLKNSGRATLNAHAYQLNAGNQRTNQTRVGILSAALATNYVDYAYDAIGQLKIASGKEGTSTTNRWHEQFGYAYDAAGNLNQRTNHSLLQTFNVDNLNQLTTVTRGRSSVMTVAGTTTSAATNVTVNTSNALRYADATFASTNHTLADGTNTFTAIGWDNLGRVDTNVLTLNLPNSVSFLYDQNGNLRTNGTRVFQYDDENQLICVTEPGAWMVANVYDGKLRRRIERNYQWTGSAWVQTNEVRFIYDGNVVLQERNEFNIPSITLTRGNDLSGLLQGAGGIGGLLATTESSSLSPLPSYFHADGNGNVTCLVDANQNVMARYLYDPFGSTLSSSGPKAAFNQYRFSSKPVHEPSGMYDYLRRWYAADLQRWISRDPLSNIIPQDTLSRINSIDFEYASNLYVPFSNNPISYVDPNGEFPVLLGAAFVGVAIAYIIWHDFHRLHAPVITPNPHPPERPEPPILCNPPNRPWQPPPRFQDPNDPFRYRDPNDPSRTLPRRGRAAVSDTEGIISMAV